MNDQVRRQLIQALETIDRPGTFCVSGKSPAVLPGLEVEGIGPIGLPLLTSQAQELIACCDQAAYGKGEETVVDTSVRRVWRLTPDRFALKNPAWTEALFHIVETVQKELGLEKQPLDAHLYDLLLYEKGSFFLPHKDGEKLERMVATLVVVLPSAFEGGELVVHHEEEVHTLDLGGGKDLYHIHFAAFYADCEHEVRPLRAGYRLCLIYNLTLAKTEAKQGLGAPSASSAITQITELLEGWTRDESATRLVVTLGHQYTEAGVSWETLKGLDRSKAHVLAEAAKRAGCRVYLALLTLHESGSPEGGDYDYEYGRRRSRWNRYEEEDEGEGTDGPKRTMGEIHEITLDATHWSSPDGKTAPIPRLSIDEEELLDEEALREITPEEQFEGYTGNAGMTLDHWYRHAAIILWPEAKHYANLSSMGSHTASKLLAEMASNLPVGKTNSARQRAELAEFARAILESWPAHHYSNSWSGAPCSMLQALAKLDDVDLIRSYLGKVLIKDTSIEPGNPLVTVCERHGWATFQQELEAVFASYTGPALIRNARILETLCLAKPRKKAGWSNLCADLGNRLVKTLMEFDHLDRKTIPYQEQLHDRTKVVQPLVCALLATEQKDAFQQFLDHTLELPALYPMIEVHFKVFAELQPWITKNIPKDSAALKSWLTVVRKHLKTLTASMPQPPADMRRSADLNCKCAHCQRLARFLADPVEREFQFRAAQGERLHVESMIGTNQCDVDHKTVKQGSPHILVCTKNTNSYKQSLKKYHEDLERLALVQKVEARS